MRLTVSSAHKGQSADEQFGIQEVLRRVATANWIRIERTTTQNGHSRAMNREMGFPLCCIGRIPWIHLP
jgi:hypothetical protein